MTKARILADLISDNAELADGTISVAEVVGAAPLASPTFTGTVAAASLDISGDIDVDGTTNLDVVDIDGAVNMATTALVTGVLTTTAETLFNGGINLPTVNTFIKGGGHNVIQVDANITYLYGGGGGLSFRNADNSAELISITNAGVLTTTAATVFNGGFAAGGVGSFANGSVSAPAITNTGDLNTGMFFPADETVGFTSGGVPSFNLNNQGNIVYVGSMQIQSDAQTGLLALAGGNNSNDGANIGLHGPSNASLANVTRFRQDTVESMRITAQGNIGVGTTTPTNLTDQTSLTINGTSVGRLDLQGTGQLYANGTEIVLQGAYGKIAAIDAGTNQYISFRYATAEKARISSSVFSVGEIQEQTHGVDVNITMVSEDAGLAIMCRSATDGHTPYITMMKTPALSGNYTATASGDFLGLIDFRGVNTSAVSDVGASIRVKQTGTASGTVPAEMQFWTAEAQRMTLDKTGALLIARTATIHGGKISLDYTNGVTSGIAIKDTETSGTGVPVQIVNGAGTIVGSITQNQSSTAFNTSSDYRLKENVVYDWDATTRLKQLKPARFNFIADADTTVDGFLAHEAQAVVPECATGTHNEVDDGGAAVMQGIDQSKLVPLLVKTIQELEARITALEA